MKQEKESGQVCMKERRKGWAYIGVHEAGESEFRGGARAYARIDDHYLLPWILICAQ